MINNYFAFMHFQHFLGKQVMCLHFVQGPEMMHSYSITILSLQLTLLIEKMLPFETTGFDECPKL
jgi:hypothetical protein